MQVENEKKLYTFCFSNDNSKKQNSNVEHILVHLWINNKEF